MPTISVPTFCLGSGWAPNRHQGATLQLLACVSGLPTNFTRCRSRSGDWLVGRPSLSGPVPHITPPSFCYQPHRFQQQGQNGHSISTIRPCFVMFKHTLEAESGLTPLHALHWQCSNRPHECFLRGLILTLKQRLLIGYPGLHTTNRMNGVFRSRAKVVTRLSHRKYSRSRGPGDSIIATAAGAGNGKRESLEDHSNPVELQAP